MTPDDIKRKLAAAQAEGTYSCCHKYGVCIQELLGLIAEAYVLVDTAAYSYDCEPWKVLAAKLKPYAELEGENLD